MLPTVGRGRVHGRVMCLEVVGVLGESNRGRLVLLVPLVVDVARQWRRRCRRPSFYADIHQRSCVTEAPRDTHCMSTV